MTETKESPTKALFDSLAKLYKQGQLLLMDADRLVGGHGWEPTNTMAPYEFSYSLNSPEKWYARYVARYYVPTVSDEADEYINQIIFVSIQFASDHDTEVEEPIVASGRLIYRHPMNLKTAKKSYHNWMCKYWFYNKQGHNTLKGWRQGGQSRFFQNLAGNETFTVPLYDVTSSEKLKELVIEPLLTGIEKQEKGG